MRAATTRVFCLGLGARLPLGFAALALGLVLTIAVPPFLGLVSIRPAVVLLRFYASSAASIPAAVAAAASATALL